VVQHLPVPSFLNIFLISNFRHVLNVVCFLLGNCPVSELYMPTFLFHLQRQIGMKEWRILHTYPPMKMEQTECSEISAYKIETPGNYPEESIQLTESCLWGYLVGLLEWGGVLVARPICVGFETTLLFVVGTGLQTPETT